MTTEDFAPTHVVPREGLPAWEAPDVSRPTEPLDPFLPVRLLDRRGDWGQILCANGWSAWVDGRLLVAVPEPPPAAGQPLARTADPRPLLARVEESLARYRSAASDLADGRADGETFRRRTVGLRAGMVVDGEAVWLYDAEHERWVYCDGRHLSTYAASTPRRTAEPATSGYGQPAPAPEPATDGYGQPPPGPEPATSGIEPPGPSARPAAATRVNSDGPPPAGHRPPEAFGPDREADREPPDTSY
ncbi:hypothetical protein [Streptomyces sp. SYSU K21746]